MSFIRTNEVKTYYEMTGDGPPLIFIHGLANCTEAWEPQVKAFSKKFTVITYDLRGHGKTKGHGDKYTINTFVKDLRELIMGLRIRNPRICGLSLGGMIAQKYASKYKVHSLILSDTFRTGKLTVLLHYLPSELAENITQKLPKRLFTEFGIMIMATTKKEIRTSLEKWFKKITEVELKKSLLAAYNFDKVDLSKINVPTLILVGEKENPIVKVGSKKIHNGIRGSRRVVINDAIHLSNLENSEQFNWILNLFLTENL